MKHPRTQVPNCSAPRLDDWGVEVSSTMILQDGDGPAVGDRPPYDLDERSALFGEAIIRFAKEIPHSPVNNRLIDQLVGASTSIGANYCEADDGVSGKDYRNRIGTCRKEARETKHFLRMIATARRRPGRGSPTAVARSQGIASHFLRDLPGTKINTQKPNHPNTQRK